jgi:hypothetical protein
MDTTNNKSSLTVEQAADRVLAVICHMSGGNTQISISKADLIAEVQRLKILEMSEDEFAEYLRKTAGARNS